MARMKKVMDIDEGGSHLVVYKSYDKKDFNPYKIYLIISGHGELPVRKKLLDKYCDILSVVYFVRNFYLDGVNKMTYEDTLAWAREGYGSY